MNKNKSELPQKLEQENRGTGRPRKEFQEVQDGQLEEF